MGRDYTKILRDRGSYDPAKMRAEFEQADLRRLLGAWEAAKGTVRAEFMAATGLRPDPDATPRT